MAPVDGIGNGCRSLPAALRAGDVAPQSGAKGLRRTALRAGRGQSAAG
jgi:hypothetical protein